MQREKERERERERGSYPRVTPKTPAGIPEFVGEIPFLAPLVRPSSRKTLLSFVRASRYGTMLTYSEEEFYRPSYPVKWPPWPASPAFSSFCVIAVREGGGKRNGVWYESVNMSSVGELFSRWYAVSMHDFARGKKD